MNDIRRVVIIGAGECGVQAALTLRDEGYEGDIHLVHGEAVTPYERPPLSKPGLDHPVLKPIMGTDRFLSEKIEMIHDQRAVYIDRQAKQITLSNNHIIFYDRLLLATGARPRRLTMDGNSCENVFVLRTFSEATALYDEFKPGCRLSVIGGGFIGLELAAAARQRGVHTTLIESASRLLGRAVPSAHASRLEERHRKEGVVFHIGKSIASINSSRTITLSDGSIISSDVIVAGIGSVPNIELAEAAGLLIDNGIAVDGRLRTSDPDIFAAGDCCSFPHPLYGNKNIRIESWRAAQEQGTHAAKSMLGFTDTYSAVPWFWSDHYELTLQIAGLPTEAVQEVERKLDENASLLFHLAEDGRLLAASGLGIGNSVARDIRLAEMLISKQARPAPSSLADPLFKLKSLLSSTD